MCKQNDTNKTQDILYKVIEDIMSWSTISGAKLSLEKCKVLHICRKQNFPHINININNIFIENVNELKILGQTFSNKYKWKLHCNNLRKSLATTTNTISYLASKKLNVHVNTLFRITKAIVISKIIYGLEIYGNCPKSTFNVLKPYYHQAARRSIGAFRTTPILNILAEAGLPTLEENTLENANTRKYISSTV